MITIIQIKKRINNFFTQILYKLYNFTLIIKYYLKPYKNNINICISTTKGYADKTIPKLIDNLINNNIAIEKIYVFEGGYHVNEKNNSVGYQHYYVSHNSFDLTALISILELNIIQDNWLLLHDTIELDDSFKYKFHTIKTKTYDCQPINNYPSMNIGIYNGKYIEKNKDYLYEMKNINYSEDNLQKFKKLNIENEDYLFNSTKNKTIIHKTLLGNLKKRKVIYNNNIRICEYYANLGIKKYKANFKRQEHYTFEL